VSRAAALLASLPDLLPSGGGRGGGPGYPSARTPEAVEAIKAADAVTGYRTYIELI